MLCARCGCRGSRWYAHENLFNYVKLEVWNGSLIRVLGCDCQCVEQWTVIDMYDGQLGSRVVSSVNAANEWLRATADCRLVLDMVAWCSVGMHALQGAAGVSHTMLLALVRPACTDQRRGPAPGGTYHPPACMDHMCQVIWLLGCIGNNVSL